MTEPTPSAFGLALHYAHIRPDPEPIPCPRCGDELETVFDFPPSGGAQPLVCPKCLNVIHPDATQEP